MLKKFLWFVILLGVLIYGNFILSQEVKIGITVRNRELTPEMKKSFEESAGRELKFVFQPVYCDNGRQCDAQLYTEFMIKNYLKAALIKRDLLRDAKDELLNVSIKIDLPKFTNN